MNNITKITKNLGGKISKNSPVLLTIIAVGGVIGTGIFAQRGTIKAMQIVKNIEKDSDADKLTTKEVIQATWKCYIPAGLTAAATIACIIAATTIGYRRYAALTGAYTLTTKAFEEYKNKVVEQIGTNKEQKVRDEISADKIRENPVSDNEVIVTGKGDILCYDSLSGRYFKSDIEKIRQLVNELNQTLLRDDEVTLNDFYDGLNISHSEIGNQMGWRSEKGLIEVNFSSHLNEQGDPCLVIGYDVQPRYYY